MTKLLITLDSEEADVLVKWSLSEMRDPRDQIRFLVHQALVEHGLLSDVTDRAEHTRRSKKAVGNARE